MIVVDTNVLAARNLAGDLTKLAERVEERDPVWIVPPLWRYEFQSILVMTIRAKRITPENARAVWRNTSNQMAGNEHEPCPESVIELAGFYRITGYDANFIALAMEMGVPCVTEDRELQKKFPAIALAMEDFIHRGIAEGGARDKGKRDKGNRLRCPRRRVVG